MLRTCSINVKNDVGCITETVKLRNELNLFVLAASAVAAAPIVVMTLTRLDEKIVVVTCWARVWNDPLNK